jgi:hypothetical protein
MHGLITLYKQSINKYELTRAIPQGFSSINAIANAGFENK